MLRAVEPRAFGLRSGALELSVELGGTPYDGVDALVHERLAAFVDRSGDAARCVGCCFDFAGEAWLPYDTARPGAPSGERVGDTWHVSWSFYRGSFGPTLARATMAARPPALEHALRAAAVFAAMPDELYLHAATLVYEGRAWVFAGHPGAGKSTVAREGAPERVISNEISILGTRPDGTWEARPSPFWGTGDRAVWSDAAPVAAVVVLSQAARANDWGTLSGARALAALMPHVACQAPEQLHDRALLSRCAELAGAVPFGALAWFRDSHPLKGSPWKP